MPILGTATRLWDTLDRRVHTLVVRSDGTKLAGGRADRAASIGARPVLFAQGGDLPVSVTREEGKADGHAKAHVPEEEQRLGGR